MARWRILVADTNRAMTELRGVLDGQEVEVFNAVSYEKAVDVAKAWRPHLCVVGYHFDEARPYRLVTHLRAESWASDIPILIVRALPLFVVEKEDTDELRASYRSLGASDYLSFHAAMERHGKDAALRNFRDAVIRYLQG